MKSNSIYSVRDGYVVYKKPYEIDGHTIAGAPYAHAAEEVRSMNSGSPRDNDQLKTYFEGLGNTLKVSAAAEFAKEQSLLKKFNIDIENMNEEINLINQINVLINGVKNYKEILQRISNTKKKYDELEQYGKKSMAGNEVTRAIIQTFGHTIQSELARVRESLAPKVLTLTAEEIRDKTEAALERALLAAVDQTNYLDKDIMGDGSLTRELDALRTQIKSDPNFKNRFVSELLNTFGLGSNKLLEMAEQLKTSTKKDFRKSFNAMKKNIKSSNLKLKTQRQRAGNVAEYLQSAMADQNIKISADLMGGAATIQSNKVKTDNIIFLYQGAAEINLDSFINNLATQDTQMTGQQTFSKIESVLKDPRLSEIISKSFIIYSSSKTYGIGKTIGKMEVEKEGSVLKSVDQIASAGGNPDLPILALQTAANGYYEGDSNIIEAYKAELMNAMGQIMFDDWNTIGVGVVGGDKNRIHVMNIDGVYVPLSVLMSRTAESMSDLSKVSSVFNVSVHIEGVTYRVAKPLSDTGQWEMLWSETRNEVLKSYYRATLSTTLLSKIETLLNGLGG